MSNIVAKFQKGDVTALLSSLETLSSGEVKTCPGAKGITGGCPDGGIIKLESLIQGANNRTSEIQCGLIGADDCKDTIHAFEFYKFLGLSPTKFDESAVVPDFESSCYDPELVRNKYIQLEYECRTVDTVARLGENKTISNVREIQLLNKAYPNVTLGKTDDYLCEIDGSVNSTVIVTLIRSRVILNGDKNMLIRDSEMERCSVIPLQTFESNFGKEIYRGVYPITLYFNSSQPAVSMMWLSIKDARGLSFSANCYNVADTTRPQLPEICPSPISTPAPTSSSFVLDYKELFTGPALLGVFGLALILLTLTNVLVRRQWRHVLEVRYENDVELEVKYAHMHEERLNILTTPTDTCRESGSSKTKATGYANAANLHQEYEDTLVHHEEYTDTEVRHQERYNEKHGKQEYANTECDRHEYANTEEVYTRLEPEGMLTPNEYETLATQHV
ncbi:unnamed protein product [Owenia fusiformis]|uniref:Uncharacterized protein n=1 Tax=Owenia fusiformis TaxID=6347 RepID=A0A8S4Q6W1_OWEFU|nr:unnamed protein product [Owenia fusiformis]